MTWRALEAEVAAEFRELSGCRTRLDRLSYRKRQALRHWSKLTCARCRKTFWPATRPRGGHPRLYCSVTCRQAVQGQRKSTRRAARLRALEPGPRVCPHCRASFQYRRRDQVYCSATCRKRAIAARYYRTTVEPGPRRDARLRTKKAHAAKPKTRSRKRRWDAARGRAQREAKREARRARFAALNAARPPRRSRET